MTGQETIDEALIRRLLTPSAARDAGLRGRHRADGCSQVRQTDPIDTGSEDQAQRRADDRRARAVVIASELDLVQRWSAVGRVAVVGAVAYDLVVSLDIDLEVFTLGPPSIATGFSIAADLAQLSKVSRVRFYNGLASANMGLYWQIRYRDEVGDDWKIDVWVMAEGHPGPLSAEMVEPIRTALTPELRDTILRLKEARSAGLVKPFSSIDLYRAVIDGGVRNPDALEAYLGLDYQPALRRWTPSPRT